MKTKYEYKVTAVAKDGYPVDTVVDTRSQARQTKKDFVDLYGCTKAKIIQRKYELKQEQTVR